MNLVKCFLTSGYTEEPKVVKEAVCKGGAASVLFRDMDITADDRVEVVVCYPDSDVYMASARFERRVIGTNSQTGRPLRGILVHPPYQNKPFPPGTKLAVVMAIEPEKEDSCA